MPAGGVASVRAGSWLVAPVTGGCCASPSATSWSGAGSSGTAPPCYCSLQVCRVEWQEKRQGWLVAMVGKKQEEKAKIILSFVFLDISLLLHSPTQDTEVWCAPPLEEGETCRLCSLSGCGQLLLRATTSCRLLLLSTETSQLGAYSPPASPALQPLQPGPFSVTPAGEDHPGPFLQHLRHQEAIFLIANSHSAVHHPQPPDGVALGSVALHIPAGSQFPVDTCI